MAVPVSAPRPGAELTPHGDRARDVGSAARGWRRVPTAIYPLLLAVFPTLSMVSHTAGGYTASDLAVVLAALLALTALVVAACTAGMRLLGRDAPLERGAFVALLVVVWVFYFAAIQNAVGGVAAPLARSAVLGPIMLAVTGVLLRLALRTRWALGGIGRFLALAGTLLVANAGLRVGSSIAGSRARAERSQVWGVMHQPVPVKPAFVAPAARPDIYVVVLDGYPNAEVLRTKFGYDNTPFLDSLRALGFTIPKRLRSNYTSTVLSLMSLLNFEHDTLLARDVAPNSVDHSIPAALIGENRTVRFLKERGYRYLLYPSEWFQFTRSSPLADYVYPGPPARSVTAEIQKSELRRVVFGSTILAKFPLFRGRYGGQFILDEFERLHEIPDRAEPTFTLAHFILPHQPVVVDGRCRPTNAPRMVSGERIGLPAPRPVFIGAIECGNRQVLSLVRDVLRRSPAPPIIMVIGDHGTLSRGWAVDAKLPVDSVAAERLAPLGAFYMPNGGAALFADSLTHVNIFRNVLRHYFGADLPPASNEGFFNQAGEAYRFRPVDEHVVIGG